MELKVKITPKKVTAANKEVLLSKIKYGHNLCIGTLGVFLTSFSSRDDVARVYTCEKRRRKVIQHKSDNGKTISSVVYPSHWVAHYYDIPRALLDAMKVNVVQGARTFKFYHR